ncbi:uncharacterized protein E5676_scaffold347G001880 [Cucumis melo var. makuwa]|uniref:DUF3754 domain-containing protein n=1 Tax=Cucumis melo var. makuwa TaxID=1194695 RepID=A0A5D3BXV4_CUCMM|nr:uncharacterized protein E6C27_scaffold242G00600 [Cucumis melo var. makuwa]TYK03990.1 uncharacterized protein E5676_scaffold347G001880 [Cucumis melo var. makuwa]
MLSSLQLPTGLRSSAPLLSPIPQGHRQCLPLPSSSSLTAFPDMSTQPLESIAAEPSTFNQWQNNNGDMADDDYEDKDISRIPVPRHKHIPVSKARLLDAIVSTFFNSNHADDDHNDAQHFQLISSCLDSILHAEHKKILEEMRSDYSLSQSLENEATPAEVSTNTDGQLVSNETEVSTTAKDAMVGIESMEDLVQKIGVSSAMPFGYSLDFRNLLSSPKGGINSYINGESSVAVATRFQRSFMKLLKNAQFEELSAMDLVLTSALNTDYLLTLPIYVDWKRASESNAIIFRRGYATERQRGLLIVDKLDYIQSRLLRGLFSLISKPLRRLGTWIAEAALGAPQMQEIQEWVKRLRLWVRDLPMSQQLFRYDEEDSDDLLRDNQISDKDLPIWLAAQSAVSRYEGILSSTGPRGRLLRRLLTWIGLLPPMPEQPFKLTDDSKAFEPYLRPIFISRISLSDIWRPAMKNCGNDIWKQLKTSISILLSQSVLQEPAFEELILLYTKNGRNSGDRTEVPSLQLKIYEKIPIPDLPVIFPDKKLSFRIIDALRLDAATILGLLAFFINYKFENVLSSPSAIVLDVVAFSALVIYITRVVLGYKQTWDRYQLLVNRTLYEKTIASGFGSVHFLLDASEQQQYKEAILAYAILLKEEKGEVTCGKSVGDKCEKFLYEVLKVKVEMAIDNAIDTLSRLGLVTLTEVEAEDGRTRVQAVGCGKAYEALKQHWNNLLASAL